MFTDIPDRVETFLLVIGQINSVTEVEGSLIVRVEVQRAQSEISPAPTDKLAAEASGPCKNVFRIF